MKSLTKYINRLFYPIQGEIWCLHRVLPERSMIPQNRELEITPRYLEELITEYKEKGYVFCSLNDIYHQFLPKFHFPFQKKFVNVSFDDGFIDIYTEAFPILKKHNVPFTVYLTTDFADKKAIIWWVLLEKIILKNNEIKLSTGEIVSCKDVDEKIRTYDVFLKRVFTSKRNSTEEFMTLFSNYKDDFLKINTDLTLDWSQVQEMCHSGLCTVGSHSVSHPDLTRISSEQVRHELTLSKNIIEKKLNQEVIHFSYPHSFRNEYIENETRKIYKTATLGYGGSVKYKVNPYRMPRIYVVEKQK